MPSCIVHGCTSSSKTKDPAPVLHAFPPEIESVRTWLLQTKQEFGDFEEFCTKIAEAPRGSYRMCSLHFGKECYEIRGRCFFLKKGAVPTMFTQSKAQRDVADEEPCTSLKRSKRPSMTLTDAELTAIEHNYAEIPRASAQDVSSGNQAFDTSNTDNAVTVKVEIMPDNYPTVVPLVDTSGKSEKRKKVRLPAPPKLYRWQIADNGRRVHRTTNTDLYFGKLHKKINTNIRPKHHSTGIQCNLANLPDLQNEMTRCQPMPSLDALAFSSRSIRKMVLHRGRVYVDLGGEEEDDDEDYEF